jgi:hypothetical protein
MDYKIAEIDLNVALDRLHIDLPSNLCFFPENIDSAQNEDEFIFTDSVSELIKVFKQHQIEFSTLGGKINLLRSRKNADFFAPVIFLSLSLISENPNLISLSLSVLSNYISDFFKGSIGQKKVNLEFYLETTKDKTIKKLSYNGNVEGIVELEKVIKSLNK